MRLALRLSGGDALLINNNASGFIFRGDEQPDLPSTGSNFDFEQSTVVGNLTIQATEGDVTNEDETSLTVTETFRISAGTTNTNSLSQINNEFDVLIGNSLNDNFDIDTIEINSQDASVQLDADVIVSSTFVGEIIDDNLGDGTLVLSSLGSIVQDAETELVVSQAGFSTDTFLQLTNLTSDRLAVSALGSTDVSDLASTITQIPIDDADEFAPATFENFDTGFDIDPNYGIVVVNQGDLVIGSVSDALGLSLIHISEPTRPY